MENKIDNILDGYNIFFKSGKYNLHTLHKEFSISEYYNSAKDIRSYDLNELYDDLSSIGGSHFKEETFDEYISKHLKLTNQSFKEKLISYCKTLKSDKQQNAALFSLLANLQNYINILTSTEDPSCRSVMENIEESRDFVLKTFSPQLGLVSDRKISERRESLSTYFRGIEKLRFDLQKQEVALLFTLMIDSRIMDFPCTDSELAKFLDLNVKYRNSENNKFTAMSTSLSTIDKLRSRRYDPDKLARGLINKLNVSIHEIKLKK